MNFTMKIKKIANFRNCRPQNRSLTNPKTQNANLKAFYIYRWFPAIKNYSKLTTPFRLTSQQPRKEGGRRGKDEKR